VSQKDWAHVARGHLCGVLVSFGLICGSLLMCIGLFWNGIGVLCRRLVSQNDWARVARGYLFGV